MNKIFSKSLKHTVVSEILIFLLTIATSQCFAQSPSATARPNAEKEKLYSDIINSLFYYIQDNYVEEVDLEVLYQGAIKGMLQALNDPYSVYMPKDEWRSLQDTTVGSFGGVGLSITKPTESTPEKPAYVEVSQPIDNSPGAMAGIRAGDLIVEIDGVDTASITMNEVLDRLRGVVGTKVKVKIRRGKTMEFEVELVRAIIENPTVKYGMIGTTGYVRVTEFSSTTAKRFQEAIDSFTKSGYKALVIDLRNNGGGLLTAAVDIADKFIDKGVIVSTKSRLSYENAVYFAKKSKTTVKDIPTIVLINGATASASEILSGALKDTKKAYLVGEKTYGKGSVQIPSNLVSEDGFKITVARYYSPSDTNIDKVGIKPDKQVSYEEFTEDEEKAYAELMKADVIAPYVENHPTMTEKDISSYAEELYKKYPFDKRVIRKLIRNEYDRTQPARLYDLDYDIQLNEALRILKEEDFSKLMKNTKTLKELEAEAEKEKASNEKAAKESGK